MSFYAYALSRVRTGEFEAPPTRSPRQLSMARVFRFMASPSCCRRVQAPPPRGDRRVETSRQAA